MLYIIGLGLNHQSISKEGLEIAKKCKRIYLENYTVELPYSTGAIEETIGKKVKLADRDFIESLEIIDEATRSDIALLVYGSPLTATTHITLIQEAKKSKVKVKVLYNASIFDAIAGTGLQPYKFGKITSIPKFEADSFIEVVQQNNSMKAHSLILVDIGLEFRDAVARLAEKHNIKLKKIVVCSKLGTRNSKILYRDIAELEEFTGIKSPYCFIIPSKLHFVEKEFLEELK
jgi:diphthine synthase